MEGREFLFKLSNSMGVSGYEHNLNSLLEEYFKGYVDEISYGKLGDFIGIKKGRGSLKIMIAAHLDEVGLMVTEIDDRGFVHFRVINGIDPKTLPAQEVIIHGKKEVYGVIGAKPPHILTSEDLKKAIDVDDMLIDTGLEKDKLIEIVSPGDVITIKRDATNLLGDFITGKAFDDRAGVCAMFECAKILKDCEHYPDVYFVATVMEEVGHKGARTVTNVINPDIGIAIDVTSADKYASDDILVECGKNIKIAVGPNIHPELVEKLIETAQEQDIPYKIVAEPGRTGTDAWDIQVSGEGVATLLVSIPIKYMHTSVEVLNYTDIEKVGKLIASFILSLKDWSDIYA
ncbi:M42 family metallopeptidase [Caloramator sp. E03]|uniref:M20/M25/M40 family metallo-hydrolase n=1 Tax=Caloramator sp. E03 TaxID=2576307 RepID=UPI001110C200|nr:M20/M25/M40 family metallo-hydrolase [Caloramator sp. E03]QCX34585.1 M42 family metallopeptidase [Caloramator sp. E03]